jgi:8-oxo-dGTP pyrophosphatase MutT (NUDIX family)
MTTPSVPIRQAAAIPVRAGRLCLVLSRSGKQWVIPKGRIEFDQSAGETALREAWEEAGLLGVLQPEPVGSYVYEKCGQSWHVTVFLLLVTEVSDRWPEGDWRPRRWVRASQALAHVSHPGLRKLLRKMLTAELMPLPA